jgi:hypothetical protein
MLDVRSSLLYWALAGIATTDSREVVNAILLLLLFFPALAIMILIVCHWRECEHCGGRLPLNIIHWASRSYQRNPNG